MPYRKVRPHPNEKPERNRLMVLYSQEHPEATVADISRVFNISGSRVHQIVTREKKKLATAV